LFWKSLKRKKRPKLLKLQLKHWLKRRLVKKKLRKKLQLLRKKMIRNLKQNNLNKNLLRTMLSHKLKKESLLRRTLVLSFTTSVCFLMAAPATRKHLSNYSRLRALKKETSLN
jgi:hypothetical protein